MTNPQILELSSPSPRQNHRILTQKMGPPEIGRNPNREGDRFCLAILKHASDCNGGNKKNLPSLFPRAFLRRRFVKETRFTNQSKPTTQANCKVYFLNRQVRQNRQGKRNLLKNSYFLADRFLALLASLAVYLTLQSA